MKTAVENEMGQKQFVPREQYEKLLSEHEYAKQQPAELKPLIFGSKSERYIATETGSQMSLFNIGQETVQEVEIEDVTYSRKKPKQEKQHPVRIPIISHLPLVEEIIEPENLDENSKKIGEEIMEVLEYNPAKVWVRKIVRPKYAKANNEGVAITELPSLPLPKVNTGASMLAYIQVSKYINHLPYHHQVQFFKGLGLF